MLQPNHIEELIVLIAAMDRAALVRQLRDFRATFPLDFTNEFLEAVPLDRLRHIFLAVCLHSQQMPEFGEEEADVPAPHAA